MARAALVAARARLREAGVRVVLTNGVFDLLHVGHLRYLQAARALGDCLIVGVNDDDGVRRLKGPTRPIVPAAERAELVAGLGCVDYVTIFGEDTAAELVRALQPDVYVKGGDYAAPGSTTGKPLPEAEVVTAAGGEVVIIPLVPGASLRDACALANEAAGIVIRKRGNQPVTLDELAAALDHDPTLQPAVAPWER